MCCDRNNVSGTKVMIFNQMALAYLRNIGQINMKRFSDSHNTILKKKSWTRAYATIKYFET